ncbi:T9SS type A sorting domain-containing protein [candidate division KSB1 bacterium]
MLGTVTGAAVGYLVPHFHKMKTKNILSFFLLLSFSFICIAQTQWTKYPSNPVIKKQNFITEFYAIGQPTVIIENDTIKMWYVAAGLPYITSRLLYAWSLDGINWTKYNSGASVMDPGSTGSWDVWIDTPEIYHDTSGYKLYYYGDTVAAEGGKPSSLSGIGVATSSNGINWIKYSNSPVLTHGNAGEWDQHWIESPAVLYDSISGKYLMWYTGVDTSLWRIQIGLAMSSDGFAWTKYSANPVLSIGVSGSYDDMWVAVPGVIKKGNLYEMWYSTFSSVSGFSKFYIAYATSSDGINWTKHPANPLFNTFTNPYDSLVDSGGPWAPDIVFDSNDNKYKIWYETISGFCMATAPENLSAIYSNNISSNELLIFPNPFSSTTTIRTNEPLNKATLKIINLLGQTVKIKEKVSGKETQIDRVGLLNGVYFIQLMNNNKIIIGKLKVE